MEGRLGGKGKTLNSSKLLFKLLAALDTDYYLILGEDSLVFGPTEWRANEQLVSRQNQTIFLVLARLLE